MSNIPEISHLLWESIKTIGSILGLIGGIIILFRFIKERPILKIDLFSTHEIDEDDRTTTFSVNLDLDNVGDKPTTIKSIFFSISDFKETDWHFMPFEDFQIFNLNPRSSKRFSHEVILDETFEEHMKMYVTIDHTHGETEKKGESYYVGDVLLDDDDEY